jgi:hypothetical protein
MLAENPDRITGAILKGVVENAFLREMQPGDNHQQALSCVFLLVGHIAVSRVTLFILHFSKLLPNREILSKRLFCCGSNDVWLLFILHFSKSLPNREILSKRLCFCCGSNDVWLLFIFHFSKSLPNREILSKRLCFCNGKQ